MASFNIHLAVGKRYIEKNPDKIKDEDKFFDGVLAPDLAPDKEVSHFGKPRNSNDTVSEFLAKKVDLRRYFLSVKNPSDYDTGVYIHLLTDYLFYTDFFGSEYLNSWGKTEYFVNDLYYSYDLVNDHLKAKYGVDCEEYLRRINNDILIKKRKQVVQNENPKDVLPIEKLDEFIENVSDINLEKYRKNILSK